MDGQNCPCCGTRMEEEDRGTRLLLRCPSCGLADLRIKH
jgi:transposase